MFAHLKKRYNQPRQLLKSRDVTLLTKACLVKAMIFPVVMCECESWTIKKAEHQRTDAFELWCWRRLLRVPCAARRYKQSILKEISPGCSLEGLMLMLKLQYFRYLLPRVDSLERPWCWEVLGAIRVVSSAYLRLFIFLLAILIPACASSTPAFLMMYSAYKLNKQGDL